VEKTMKERVSALEETLQCNCDLDRWEPEPDTGHSWVCRIHTTAKLNHRVASQRYSTDDDV